MLYTEIDEFEMNYYKGAARISDMTDRYLCGERDLKKLKVNESGVFGIQIIMNADFSDLAYCKELDCATVRRMGDFISPNHAGKYLGESACYAYFNPANSFCHDDYMYCIGRALIVKTFNGYYLPIDEETKELAIKEFKQKLVTLQEGNEKIVAFKDERW